MTPEADCRPILRSGPFVLDRRRRQLTRVGEDVPLRGLPLRILELLMAADGGVVTRTELKQLLWPYAERIDTERRLNTAIRALRKALGDAAAAPGHVATIRSHGYRWIGHEAPAVRRSHRWQLVAVLVA